jgi:hypothetical protein
MQCNVMYQHRYSVNVWCGLLGNCLIGSHFFEGRVTGAFYCVFLQSHLPLYLEDVLLAIQHGLWMQHDGAPHSTREVISLLNEHFADRWLGRVGPVPWPARSTDLSPLDVFVWGSMKSRVYMNGKPDTREQLMQRINEVLLASEMNWSACSGYSHWRYIL